MHRRSPFSLILDALYPKHCPVCHGIAPEGLAICPSCRKRLPYVRGRRCEKCGKPADSPGRYCRDCLKTKHIFTKGIGIFLYDDVMHDTIARFKYEWRPEYGEILGSLAADAAGPYLASWKAEAVIPVPAHKSRIRRRGYNQAELLAKGVAKRSGIPMRAKLLGRASRTEALKNLTREERKAYCLTAFTVKGKRIPSRVLLIDDIYTTGATADGCALALRKAGVKEVYVLTLCIGTGYGNTL